MNYKAILGIVPGLQATSLVAHNIPKFAMKPSKKMDVKKQTKEIVKKGVATLIGIGLLKPTAKMIGDLPTV